MDEKVKKEAGSRGGGISPLWHDLQFIKDEKICQKWKMHKNSNLLLTELFCPGLLSPIALSPGINPCKKDYLWHTRIYRSKIAARIYNVQSLIHNILTYWIIWLCVLYNIAAISISRKYACRIYIFILHAAMLCSTRPYNPVHSYSRNFLGNFCIFQWS